MVSPSETVRSVTGRHDPPVLFVQMVYVAAKAAFGNGAIYAGLIYPIAVCLLTVVVGGLLIHETKDHKIDTPIH